MDRQRNLRAARLADRRRFLRRAAPLLLVAMLAATQAGCQIIIGVMQIFQGFPLDDCDFKTQTHGRRLDEKGKKVVILCTSESTAQFELPSLDADIIGEVTRRFQSQSIKVVDSHKVTNWIDDNGGRLDDEADLTAIGKNFDVDFIVLIKIDDFGTRAENSPGYYQGRIKGSVTVVELKADAPGKKRHPRQIYQRPFDSKYPKNQPIPATDEKQETFQQRFLTLLSHELSRLFYDHRLEDEM